MSFAISWAVTSRFSSSERIEGQAVVLTPV
jgi:hypothetical protein